MSRAPDEVREAIEAWVKGEPHCATSLDVRVVPTDGGYYLFARDGSGRVRERVVPDAQSAGVLVASWVADDGIGAPVPPPPSPPSGPAPAAEVPPVAMPPGAAPIHTSTAAPPERDGKWVTFGGIVQMHGGGAGGLRADLDIIRRGRWSLGAIVAGSSADLHLADSSWGYISTVDMRALAALSRTTTIGRRWDMRLTLGAGVMSTYARGEVNGADIEAQAVFPNAEASLLLSRGFRNSGWAIALGPVVTWYSQTYKLKDGFGGMQTLANRGLEAMAFGGVRRRL